MAKDILPGGLADNKPDSDFDPKALKEGIKVELMADNRCRCGCGAIVNFLYKKGHGRKGRKNSAEHNAAISQAHIGKQISDKERARLLAINIGRKQSKETREKISRIAKEKGFGKWMTGRKLPESTLVKLRGRKLGPHRESTKLKISQKNAGSGNGMFGQKHSDVTKEKIRQAAIHMWDTQRPQLIAAANTEQKRNKLRIARQKLVLPKKDTNPEIHAQQLLLESGIKFEKHMVMKINRPYQADLYLPEFNMVIEIDGLYWHNYPYLRPIDIERTNSLLEMGFKVIRFWEHEICKIQNYNDLIEIIKSGDKSRLESLPMPKIYKRFVGKYGIK